MDYVWPVVGLGAVVLASWALWKEIRGLSIADVETALWAIAPLHWILTFLATLMAYCALAWYDQIALAHMGRRLNWGFIAVVSFTTYALSHNIGFTMLSGAVVRYRAYSTKGLGVVEVGLLVAFCAFTFTLGNVLLGGFVLLFDPDIVRRWLDLPAWVGPSLGLLMLSAVCLYVVGSLLHFAPLRIGGFELVYPRPPIAARQLLAGPVELIGAAGIIYFALPAVGNPGFLIVLGIFLASFTAALISHAPGGLGVLEFAFITALPEAPKADVLAALIVFRLFYLILPLIFALIVVALFERQRISELLHAK
jgi:glycosyltransferase 2 family protein